MAENFDDETLVKLTRDSFNFLNPDKAVWKVIQDFLDDKLKLDIAKRNLLIQYSFNSRSKRGHSRSMLEMKREIFTHIGYEGTRNATISRDELGAIHAYVMGLKMKSTKS